MTDPDIITRLRNGHERIHAIGPVRAADLLKEAADRIEDLEAEIVGPVRRFPIADEAAVAALLRETYREAAGTNGTLPELVGAVRRGAALAEDDVRESPTAEVNGFMAEAALGPVRDINPILAGTSKEP